MSVSAGQLGKLFKRVFLNRGVFFVAGALIMRAIMLSEHDTTIAEEFEFSQNKEYLAISYVNMGGGAAGFCYTYVAIVPRNKMPYFQKAEYTIAAGRCANTPSVNWIGSNVLKIDGLSSPHQQEASNSDGTISIVY